MHSVAEHIRAWMVAHGKTLSTAESCTSGRIAAKLTSVSGASKYFQGGVVAYQDELKIRFLGVKTDTIQQHDVVSREVVEQMVLGSIELFHTDYAIASTGYTGSGVNGIAAGTVWIGWGSKDDVQTCCLSGDLGREENTERAAHTAIERFEKFVVE